jgi:hypothetical protein
MTTRQYLSSKSSRSLVAAALLIGSATLAGAQNTQVAAADARWAPWVGCWQPSSLDPITQNLAPNKSAPIVCIAPAAGNAVVDLITVSDSTVGKPERVDANGARREVGRDGCTGWETAEFSPDAKRIYLKTEHKCTGNRTRTSTGIMSITPTGQWLDVQGVRVDSHSAVRVVRYGRVPVPANLSAEMRSALEQGGMATSLAVMAASDSIRIADVVEATKRVDGLVVQTWLAQSGQGFTLDAKRLAQLADAKVPSNVIDVMVALSYPQAFAVNLAQSDGQIIQTSGVRPNAEEAIGNGPMVFMSWDPFYSSSYGYYSRYGYNGLGYSGGYYPPYYQGTPVVITRPSGSVDLPERDTRGRMVRGSGYTRPPDRGDGGSSAGSPRSSTSDGGSRTTGASTGSSGGGDRTAKPRSP